MYDKKEKENKFREILMKNEAWKALHEIGKAIEAKNDGVLHQVSKDSPQWKAWRRWLVDHGLGTKWYDRQNADKIFTVTAPWPPTEKELNAPLAYILANSKNKNKETELED